MKQGELIFGVFLVIVGALLFFAGEFMSIPFSRISIILISFGIILFIAGVVVSIMGASSPSNKKKKLCNKGDILKNETYTKRIESPSHDEALNIIRLRYAKGEITKEQYEQMKKDLENE